MSPEGNWQEEIRGTLKSLEELKDFFSSSPSHFEQLNFDFDFKKYPLFLPRKFATKILAHPINSPLWKQFIPNPAELKIDGEIDPIGDQLYNQAPQIIHRYKNRVLFTPTSLCPIHCRYCFRKNELYSGEDFLRAQFEKTLNYLQEQTSINEIIFTGGDPLMLSNSKLHHYFLEFSKIPHIKYLRLHTRFPVIIPSRVDTELIDILSFAKSKFKRLFISIHVNHLDEIDFENGQKIQMLANHFELLSQTVLLKGVNDSSQSLISLFEKLADLGVTPYYLHHPDRAQGTSHFWLSLEEGRKIYSKLRDSLSGWALPQYIIDIPNGEGKTQAFNPESFEFSQNLIGRYGQNVSVAYK